MTGPPAPGKPTEQSEKSPDSDFLKRLRESVEAARAADKRKGPAEQADAGRPEDGKTPGGLAREAMAALGPSKASADKPEEAVKPKKAKPKAESKAARKAKAKSKSKTAGKGKKKATGKTGGKREKKS